jgi:hypothetical protein
MLHYRALAGRSAVQKPSALPSAASLTAAQASCASLAGQDTESYGALLRRLTHLRAAAASSSASVSSLGAGGVHGVGAGGGVGVAALDLLELPALMEMCVRSALTVGVSAGAGGDRGSSAAGGSGGERGRDQVPSSSSVLASSGDDAVDLIEFACSIFSTHRLLEPAIAALRVGSAAPASAPALAAGASGAPAARTNPAAAALLLHIIREVAALAGELQGGLAHSLSARAPLPLVLKAVALLKRLARLQKVAVERSVSGCAAALGGGGGARAGASSSALSDLSTSTSTTGSDGALGEDIASWLRWLFIAERDGTLARELEAAAGEAHSPLLLPSTADGGGAGAGGAGGGGAAASRGGGASAGSAAATAPHTASRSQPTLLRILELHRLLATELISQYGAVSSSLITRSGSGSAASSAAAASASSDAATRPLLVEAIGWRSGSMLALAFEALTRLPDSAMANSQQPMAYAARRSARLGVDYSAALSVAWCAVVLDTVASRLLLARRVLASADPKDERASLALLNASLRASLDVFNALRNCLPRALQNEVLAELLAHFHALADSPVVAEWPSCAGAFSEATQPLLDVLAKLLPAQLE